MSSGSNLHLLDHEIRYQVENNHVNSRDCAISIRKSKTEAK